MAEILALIAKYWTLIEHFLVAFSGQETKDQTAKVIQRMQPLIAQVLMLKSQAGSLKVSKEQFAQINITPAQLITNLELIVTDLEKAAPTLAQLVTDVIGMLKQMPRAPLPAPTPVNPLPNPNPA